MSVLRRVFNVTNLLVIGVIAYVYIIGNNLYNIMNPMANVVIDPEEETINPLWDKNQEFSLVCFLSHSSQFSPFRISELENKNNLLINLNNLTFHIDDNDSDHIEINIDIIEENSTYYGMDKVVHASNKRIWKSIRNKKSHVFLHALTVRHNEDGSPPDSITADTLNSGQGAYGVVDLVKFDVIPKYFRHRYLLTDLGFEGYSTEIEEQQAAMPSDTKIKYWKPEVAVRLVTDFTLYPIRHGGELRVFTTG